MLKLLKLYPRMENFHELKVSDFEKLQEFAAWVFRQIDIDENWLSNVLRTDDAHFYLKGEFNIQNCLILATENPRIFTEIPLHQHRVTVLCLLTRTTKFKIAAPWQQTVGFGNPGADVTSKYNKDYETEEAQGLKRETEEAQDLKRHTEEAQGLKHFATATVKRRLLAEAERRSSNLPKDVGAMVINASSKPIETEKQFKAKVVCFKCGGKGHYARECRKKGKNEQRPKRFDQNKGVNMSAMCNTLFGATAETWIIDSGATHHMTPKRDYFTCLKECTSNMSFITIANGSFIEACGIGTVSANIVGHKGDASNMVAQNTLYVPDMRHSVLSVLQMIENGRKVVFNRSGCHIMDMKAKMAKNQSVRGLDCSPAKPEKCEDCLIGKSYCLPFLQHSHKEEKEIMPLDLVHADLMGPLDVLSWGGAKYVLTIIDESTRYASVFFLKNKGGTLGKVKEWIQESEKQTNRKLKRICTDNGLEFCSKEWDTFCTSVGIVHEHTMTYTPQQKGVAERMNRTRLDLVRSTISGSGLPKASWAELTYTAAYVRNRVLNNHNGESTPYELWTGNKPSLKHIRAIGCQVFVHIPRQVRKSKLERRAVKGNLVGYALRGRGYRVWIPEMKKVVESRDCVFKESDVSRNDSNREVLPSVEHYSFGTQREIEEYPVSLLDLEDVTPTEEDSHNEKILTEVNKGDPTSHKEAIQGPEAEHWLECYKWKKPSGHFDQATGEKPTRTSSFETLKRRRPKLQQDIFNILIRFRTRPKAFSVDIEKMYRQVRIDSRDCDFQRILWRKNPSEPLLDYRLLTVTYGLSCAPYLAMRTLHQLARDKVSTFPVASKIVQTDFYVDDLLSGADTIEEATCHIREVNNLLSSAGFSLRKWRSNVPKVLSGLSEQVEDRHNLWDFENVAYAAVFYIRSHFKSGQVKVSLIASKTRVAPLKMISIPRLELNRIAEVQRLTLHSSWHYVISKDNPADCASRDFIFKYSNINQLVRITAWIYRFVFNVQCSYNERKKGHLSSSELTSSIHNIIRFIQSSEFQSEITCCKQKKSLPTNSRLLSLNPFIDESGLIRVGGRLRHSNLQFDEKHPIILPIDHFIMELIVRQCHLDHLHSGLQLTMSALRLRYWIPAGRSLVKKLIHQCMVCFRAKRQVTKQKMGDLPMHRIVKSNPFTKTGIDFAGPFLMKPNIKRSKVKLKSYVALFVCFCTKAIHIEIVSDLSSAAFFAALKRFISRRGKPSDIFSDNGTNFRGANNILREQFDILKASTIQKFISNERINWHFIPPSAPNFGESNDDDVPINYLDRWSLNQKIKNVFWKRWNRECLNNLQQRLKWQKSSPNIKEGDLILLKDTISPPEMYWSLGRITKVFPGADGKVRVVERFKGRFHISQRRRCGEGTSISPAIIEEHLTNLNSILANSGYDPANIYNADETGLFFQLIPDRTLAHKDENCRGVKRMKQRITVLLCCNSTGTEKRRLLIIGKSANLRCFRNFSPYFYCTYTSNSKAWITSSIFQEWLLQFNKQLVSEGRRINC
ncbi:hypothetical protein LAZ67_12002543 [Cordylochernes scorpioides]|uniref:Uncharacterized protein n=1 Tax=Cordylochernes scorpioides TaxID=51811 RepID=A0ABY6L1V3_9ARAC|nr:hypothetical protein LAZ67_12002543 [Cordylochernes scorpioides]